MESSPVTINKEEEEEEEDSYYDNNSCPTLVKIRNFITKKQLQKKREKEEAFKPSKKIRRRIFAFYQYVNNKCSNFRGCCFKSKSTRCHHKLTLLEQEEWAKHIVRNMEGVSLKRPPQSFLMAYAGGHAKQQIKSSKAKKIKASTLPTMQKSSSSQKPIEIHNHYAAPVPQAAPAPSWFHDMNKVGLNLSNS